MNDLVAYFLFPQHTILENLNVTDCVRWDDDDVGDGHTVDVGASACGSCVECGFDRKQTSRGRCPSVGKEDAAAAKRD